MVELFLAFAGVIVNCYGRIRMDLQPVLPVTELTVARGGILELIRVAVQLLKADRNISDAMRGIG